MYITFLPSLKKFGLHLWQLLHGNSNKQHFLLIKGPQLHQISKSNLAESFMHITLLPSSKKIGSHLWQLLHGNGNKQHFLLIKGP